MVFFYTLLSACNLNGEGVDMAHDYVRVGLLLLLYSSGNKTKDAAYVNVPASPRKPVNKGACYVDQKH